MYRTGSMTPSDFTHALSAMSERRHTVRTTAATLMAFAVTALAGAYLLGAIAPELARLCAVMAGGGVLGAVCADRILAARRTALYDQILVAGYRHVDGYAVSRRAAKLLCPSRRLRMADSLERLVDAAQNRRRTPVPIHREALCELAPQVRAAAGLLRTESHRIEAAAMVLVARLVS